MKRKSQNKFKKQFEGKWGKFSIYIVDDELVRSNAQKAEEFGDYGVNTGRKGLRTLDFKFIPKDEIWIAVSIKPSERHFVIGNALSYIKYIESGLSSDNAYDKATKKEQARRTK